MITDSSLSSAGASANSDDAPGEHQVDLQLSPSETFAHNSAMRVSGRDQQAKTRRALASIVLGFQLFVVFLIGLTIFGLRLLEPAALGLVGAAVLCLVIVVALALMRVGRVGIVLGWAVQVATLLVGIVLPMSLIVSVIFAALWIYCQVRGAQIDRDRQAWVAAQFAESDGQ